MLQGILVFIVFLGPLIFFHELGHFFFARLFGVRVEVFSIGFGPKLLKWKRGDTEYAMSAIPLGGYVKMFGDDPFREQELTEAEKQVAFNHKSKWARFWIVFGGPLANFVLAFGLYFALVAGGEKVPEIRLGKVANSSLLHDAGFRSGDALRRINGQQLISLDDLGMVGGAVDRVSVARQGGDVDIKTAFTTQQFTDLLTEHWSTGLRAPLLVDVHGVAWALTPQQGTYDAAFSLEEAQVADKALWMHKVSELVDAPAVPKLEAAGTQVSWQGGEAGFWAWATAANLRAMDLSVGSIVMQSPADKAGLRKGDVLATLDGKELRSFEDLRDIVQKHPVGREIAVGFWRAGKLVSVRLLPESREVDKKKIMTIGVFSGFRMVTPRMLETRPVGFIGAISQAWHRTVDGVVKTVEGYKKLITKEVGLNNIGGPLAIGKVASDSFSISLSMFFRLMAIISINLGVINLFPIPVLDGGHIMFLGFELLNRGPLSRRKLEMAQRFGVSFLFLLIFIALFNDISRLIS